MDKKAVNLESMLAGLREVESGSYNGNYSLLGPRFKGRTYYGAYQIDTEYWSKWATAAGISGADMRSPQAQDRVAAHIMGQYYQRYGSWDLAAMAWLAGPEQAAKVLSRGYGDIDSIQNPKIREYVQAVSKSAEYAIENPGIAFTRAIPAAQIGIATPGNGWINPVAGSNEYSNSFYVPRTNNKTGIHGAIDVYAAKGTPIVAPVTGIIRSVKSGGIGGYTVQIQGDDGVLYYFAHMANQAVVEQGQRVAAGHHVGYVGASGNAAGTSPHLHMSMRKDGKLINPYSYLSGSGTAGVGPEYPAAEIGVTPPQPGITGTMNSWLQDMSNAVRAGAPAPEVEEEDSELADKQMQSGTTTSKMEAV